MSVRHRGEDLAVGALSSLARSLSWPAARRLGESLGTLVRWAGIRRRVARENLAQSFPEKSAAEREAILGEHYRELGRVFLEYTQLDRLAAATEIDVVGEIRGREHLLAARDQGHGAILMTGHYSNFELLAARLARIHPVDVIVRAQRNAEVEARIARLRAGRWVALVADQDAGRNGTFVPFLGRPASTTLGPAKIALATQAPIVMGFVTRRADGRLDLDVDPPLLGDATLGEGAATDLTRRHVERLEYWVRKNPAMWFWLHRRWKTRPPAPGAHPARED